MTRLALVVILFIVLIKSAIGAGLPAAVTADAELSSKISSALEQAKEEQSAQQEPWQASASTYSAELKKELGLMESLVDKKFVFSQEYLDNLDPFAQENQTFAISAASFAMICALKDAQTEELLFTLSQMRLLPSVNQEDPAALQKMLEEYEKKFASFNAEKDFTKNKASYVKIVNNLKALRAQLATSKAGGVKEFVSFSAKFTAAFK